MQQIYGIIYLTDESQGLRVPMLQKNILRYGNIYGRKCKQKLGKTVVYRSLVRKVCYTVTEKRYDFVDRK